MMLARSVKLCVLPPWCLIEMVRSLWILCTGVAQSEGFYILSMQASIQHSAQERYPLYEMKVKTRLGEVFPCWFPCQGGDSDMDVFVGSEP